MPYEIHLLYRYSVCAVCNMCTTVYRWKKKDGEGQEREREGRRYSRKQVRSELAYGSRKRSGEQYGNLLPVPFFLSTYVHMTASHMAFFIPTMQYAVVHVLCRLVQFFDI